MSIWNKYIAYLKNNPNRYWFKRKIFGWGWTPATWEGWLVLIVFVLLIIGLSLTIDKQASDRDIIFTFVLPLVILVLALIGIAYKTGEKPKWMWGFPKEQGSEPTDISPSDSQDTQR